MQQKWNHSLIFNDINKLLLILNLTYSSYIFMSFFPYFKIFSHLDSFFFHPEAAGLIDFSLSFFFPISEEQEFNMCKSAHGGEKMEPGAFSNQ